MVIIEIYSNSTNNNLNLNNCRNPKNRALEGRLLSENLRQPSFGVAELVPGWVLVLARVLAANSGLWELGGAFQLRS